MIAAATNRRRIGPTRAEIKAVAATFARPGDMVFPRDVARALGFEGDELRYQRDLICSTISAMARDGDWPYLRPGKGGATPIAPWSPDNVLRAAATFARPGQVVHPADVAIVLGYAPEHPDWKAARTGATDSIRRLGDRWPYVRPGSTAKWRRGLHVEPIASQLRPKRVVSPPKNIPLPELVVRIQVASDLKCASGGAFLDFAELESRARLLIGAQITA